MMDKTIRELYKEYYADIKDIALTIAEECNLTCPQDFQESDEAKDMLMAECDGSNGATYYSQARLVAVLSENYDYAEVEGIELDPDNYDCQRAYWAMYGDVLGLLNNEYFYQDLNKERERA